MSFPLIFFLFFFMKGCIPGVHSKTSETLKMELFRKQSKVFCQKTRLIVHDQTRQLVTELFCYHIFYQIHACHCLSTHSRTVLMIFLTANIEVNGKTIKSNSSGVTESKKGGELRQKRALRIYDRALAITTLFISSGCFKKACYDLSL